MEEFVKILVIENEFEAEIIEEVLLDKQIPYGIIVRDDSPLGGITDLESGWGYLEAPERCRAEIMAVCKEIRESSANSVEEES